MKRIAVLFLLCLLVAACFKSERLLLDRAKAAHPVAEGSWTSAAEGQTGDAFTLTIKGDHYVRVEGENRHDVVLTPMRGRPGTFAAAESSENCTGADATPECNWDYAIVIVEGDTWRQFAPSCKEPWEGMERDVAKRADDGETCWFDDPAGLEHALAIAAEKGGTSGSQQVFRRPDPTPPAEAVDPPASE